MSISTKITIEPGPDAGFEPRQYFGFENWAHIARSFRGEIGPEPELVYAVYSTPAYSGSADILFFRDNQWWHVSGGHCSCHGLEDQWEPEPFDMQAELAAARIKKRTLQIWDVDGDYPEATVGAFEAWLAWAAKRQPGGS